MAAQIFPFGTALTVVWHFSKPDGTDFNLDGYSYRAYYRTGNKETEATSTHLTASGNTLSITIPADEPVAPGEYALRLVLFQSGNLFCTLNYNAAFVLSRQLAELPPVENQEQAGQTVHLYTVAQYYLLAPVVPTVGDDGYWYVNGAKITDGNGEYIPSSHTVRYDSTTKYLIIDEGRVDKSGHSIQQTITDVATALADWEARYVAAEGSASSSVAGDGSRWGSYKSAEAVREENETARKAAEGTPADVAGADTRWGAEKQRQLNETARQNAEGTSSDEAGANTRWGAEKQRIANETARQTAEGTSGDAAGANTRWGAEKQRQLNETARQEAEGTPDDDPTDPDVTTRWAQYKRALAATERANEAAAAAEHQVDVKRGYGIDSVTEPVVSTVNGGTNTIRVTTEDGKTFDFYVRNGKSDAGFFATSTALSSAIPSPNAGDYAFVSKAGDGTFPAYIYVCTTAGTWTSTTNEFTPDDATDVLDVLNSTSTTAALSANQGKVLDGKITQLGQDTKSKLAFRPISAETLVSSRKVSSDGTISSTANWNLLVIPVKKGDVVIFYSQCATSACPLSFSLTNGTSTSDTTTPYMNGYSDSFGFYSMKSPADGFAYINVSATNLPDSKYIVIGNESLFGGLINFYSAGNNILEKYIGSEYSDTSLWGSGYLKTDGSIGSSSSYRYTVAYLPVAPGKYFSRFTMSGSATVVFYDKFKKVIGYDTQTANAVATIKREIPNNAAFARISVNSSFSSDYLAFVSQQDGISADEIAEYVFEKRGIEVIENDLNTMEPGGDWSIVNEAGVDSKSNYGQNNVKYAIPVPENATKMHIRFRFQLSRYLYTPGTANKQKIFSLNASDNSLICSASLDQRSASYDTVKKNTHRRTNFYAVGGTNNNYVTLETASKYEELSGPPAYSIKYKGSSESSLYINIGGSAVTLLDAEDNAIETITVSENATVDSVLDAINLSTNLEAVAYRTAGLNWTDVWTSSTAKLPTRNTSGDIVVYYPRILYNAEWHTFEAIYDPSTYTLSSCLDGATVKVTTTVTDAAIKSLTIGGASGVSEYNNTPIIARDLHICFNSYEDAELIDVPNQSTTGTTPQLISDIHPHVIVWEGHGIEDIRDSDTPSDTMSASTDRLRTVFAALHDKGYQPISYQQLIAWKCGDYQLPKRCYTLMFDDFRIENYMVQEKRAPFMEYGVLPGLAIITGSNGVTRSRSEEVTIDGVTWTLEEVFDAINLAGWHPCSHTKNHTELATLTPLEILPALKECADSCAKLGVYSDILVYPQGSTSKDLLCALPVSVFTLGFTVAIDGYICKAANDYLLVRTEIGQRSPLSTVLSKII